MGKSRKSTDDFIAEMAASIEQEVMGRLTPAIGKLAEALAELESAVGAAGRPRRRRGRPPKKAAGRRPVGRPRGKIRRRAKKTPRGALKATVQDILKKAKGPLTLAGIRDQVQKKAMFKKHDPKGIYTQIIRVVGQITEAKKSGKGYVLSK